jgi:hypothetical protein
MARQRQGFKQGFVRRSQQEAAEIAALEAAITAGAPAPGTNPVGNAAAHPSDDQSAGAAGRGSGGKARARRPAAKSAAEARIAGSAGAPTSGRGGEDVQQGRFMTEAYAHAKHFTELPLSSYTQVCGPTDSAASAIGRSAELVAPALAGSARWPLYQFPIYGGSAFLPVKPRQWVCSDATQ